MDEAQSSKTKRILLKSILKTAAAIIKPPRLLKKQTSEKLEHHK